MPPPIADALGVRYEILPIESAVNGLEAALAGISPARRATSPRRICRRAPAA